MRRVSAGVLLAMACVLAAEEKADPRVYAPDDKVEGKTLTQWSVAWWRWALAVKKDRNPILDKTGGFAGEGQHARVFFLAGNEGGVSKRKAKVPAGRPILFPVIFSVMCGPPGTFDEKKARAAVKAEIERAVGLEAALDDKVISLVGRRAASPVFAVMGPEKKEDAVNEDAVGKVSAVSDGVWVMLKPLKPGKYTLRFKGTQTEKKDEPAFSLDITYELTVVDEEKERKEELRRELINADEMMARHPASRMAKKEIASLREILDKADQVEVLRLHPHKADGKKAAGKRYFHGYEILATARAARAEERKAICRFLAERLHWNHLRQADCYHPRHGLRVTAGKREIDFQICFECWRVRVYEGGKLIDSCALEDKDGDSPFDRLLPAKK